jgi:D-glucosaminate-6-phosphate ammonia-lyase
MLFDRRSLVSLAAWAWLTSTFGAKTAKAKGKGIYEDLGIRPVINFRGTHTTIGASKVWPELHAAMEEASRSYVPLDELQDAVGARIAKLTGTETAFVTTGTAGAIAIGTCACVAGKDPHAIRRLPDVSGLRNEVIILKQHRNGYDHAVRNVGVKVVEPRSLDELKTMCGPKTAMMYFLGGTSGDHAWKEVFPIEETLKITKAAGVPMMVDAANMLPPWDNIPKLGAMGVDLICISGGKHMRGPQCSGILAGRRDLVEAARANSSPNSDSLGRPMKVGREEIVGIWMAVEKYAKLDFEALDRENERQAKYILAQLSKVKGLKLSFAPFDRTRKVRRLVVEWDEKALGMTAAEVEKRLWEGTPRVAVLRHAGQGLEFTCFMNDPGDEKVAAARALEVFQG